MTTNVMGRTMKNEAPRSSNLTISTFQRLRADAIASKTWIMKMEKFMEKMKCFDEEMARYAFQVNSRSGTLVGS